MLNNKNNKNNKNKDNDTLFHVILYQLSLHTLELCQVLVEAGADVNIGDKDGCSPIMICLMTLILKTEQGSQWDTTEEQVTQFFLQHSNLRTQSHSGQSVMDLALLLARVTSRKFPSEVPRFCCHLVRTIALAGGWVSRPVKPSSLVKWLGEDIYFVEELLRIGENQEKFDTQQ
jgi:hypothetical protein